MHTPSRASLQAGGASLAELTLFLQVNKVEVDSRHVKVNQNEEDRNDPEKEDLPWSAEDCTERMLQVNQFVKDVSSRFEPRPPSQWRV